MQTLYYAIAALGVLGGGLFAILRYVSRATAFFTRLDTKVDRVVYNVDLIIHNHLPHIYAAIGEKRAHEIRQDSFSESGGDRAAQGPGGPNPYVEGARNGRAEGGMEEL